MGVGFIHHERRRRGDRGAGRTELIQEETAENVRLRVCSVLIRYRLLLSPLVLLVLLVLLLLLLTTAQGTRRELGGISTKPDLHHRPLTTCADIRNRTYCFHFLFNFLTGRIVKRQVM